VKLNFGGSPKGQQEVKGTAFLENRGIERASGADIFVGSQVNEVVRKSKKLTYQNLLSLEKAQFLRRWTLANSQPRETTMFRKCNSSKKKTRTLGKINGETRGGEPSLSTDRKERKRE